MKAARALLRDCIDYAGLFPPAKLDLATTVRNYANYCCGADAWALGRLVLPASKVADYIEGWPQFAAEWPVTVLLGQEYGADIHLAVALGSPLQMVECRPARADHVSEIRRRLPDHVQLFVEGPLTCQLDESLAATADAGACAKIRTGGVTADAIPAAWEVAAFLAGCARRGLRMKATAGLHHAFAAQHPVTADADAPVARMHGFINFFVSALLAYQGASEADVQAALESDDVTSFSFCEQVLRWEGRSFSVAQIEEMRARFAVSFGSCSFEEPMSEMRSIGWLR